MVEEEGKFYPMMRLKVPKKDFYELEIADFDAYLDEMEKKLSVQPSEDVCNYTYGELLIANHSPILLAFLGKEEERLLSVAEKLEEGNMQRLNEINAQMDTLMMAKWKLEGC